MDTFNPPPSEIRLKNIQKNIFLGDCIGHADLPDRIPAIVDILPILKQYLGITILAELLIG